MDSFTVAMKKYFGYNGGNVNTFAAELRALSLAEKTDFWLMFKQIGIDCSKP